MSLCNGMNPLLSCNGDTPIIKNPIKNQKQFRMSSSSYIDRKKALSVLGPSGNLMLAQGQVNPTNNNKCVTKIGGPGDKVPAIEKRGFVRVIHGNSDAGVDRKHGSYERYLARKRGWNIVQLQCD
jgi:hypothetical protein